MNEKKIKEYLFQFQQFTISHCKSAMKVGTDGVLLGAWTPIKKAKKILDVGCGSGLISIMLAQRCNSDIIGIEIDEHAAHEAVLNAQNSPWSDRIEIKCGDVTQKETQSSLLQPDLIVSNPPFFTEALKSPEIARSTARHESSLGIESLIHIASEILSDDGRLCFISPTDRANDIEFIASMSKMHIIQRVDIKSTTTKAPVRTLWELSKSDIGKYFFDILSLRDDSGNYSEWYRILTNDYYTHLK